jgi:hypothetical protein
VETGWQNLIEVEKMPHLSLGLFAWLVTKKEKLINRNERKINLQTS